MRESTSTMKLSSSVRNAACVLIGDPSVQSLGCEFSTHILFDHFNGVRLLNIFTPSRDGTYFSVEGVPLADSNFPTFRDLEGYGSFYFLRSSP